MSYPENDPQEPKVLPGYFGPAAAPPQAERVQPAAAAPHHEPARQPFGQPGALSLPLPSASLGQAVGRLYGKYAVFGGRASRSEFWWVQLFMAGVIVLAAMLDSLIGTDVVAGLFGMFALASIVPCLALTVRRLHDANFSGGMAALWLVPYVGILIVGILALMPSSPQGARFDKVPVRTAL